MAAADLWWDKDIRERRVKTHRAVVPQAEFGLS